MIPRFEGSAHDISAPRVLNMILEACVSRWFSSFSFLFFVVGLGNVTNSQIDLQTVLFFWHSLVLADSGCEHGTVFWWWWEPKGFVEVDMERLGWKVKNFR